MEESVILDGICHQFCEQGLEAVYWTFWDWDSRYIFPLARIFLMEDLIIKVFGF